jgi:pyrroline-5-carboxylate reductase
MFGLSHSMLLSKSKTKELVTDYQTKKGINEELLKRLKQEKTFSSIDRNLTKIFDRIKKAND